MTFLSKEVTKKHILQILSTFFGVLMAIIFFYCQGFPLHMAVLTKPYRTIWVIVAGVFLAVSPLSAFISGHFIKILRVPRRRFYILVFAVALIAYLFVAKDVFKGIPRIDDGVGALFEARILAQFKTTIPLPPCAPFFKTFGVLGAESHLGHWCGMYPPGWPVLLMIGVWLGAPWVIAPFFGAMLSVLVVMLGEELFDERTGKIAGMLSISSPFMLVLSGLHLSHIPTGFFCALCLLALLRMLRTNKWQYGLLAGLAMGMALLCRPLTAAVMGMVFGGLLLFYPRKILKNIPGIIVAAIAVMIAAWIYFLFQYNITGDPFLAGHTVGMKEWGKYGFVELRPGKFYTFDDGIRNTIWRIRALNNKVLGWLFPSLVIAVIPFVFGRHKVKYYLLILPALALLAVFAGYWYFEGYFPARYIFAAVPLLFILCARSLVLINDISRRENFILHKAFVAFVYVNIIFMAFVSIPLHFKIYNKSFGDVEDNLAGVIKKFNIKNAIVFMDSMNLERGSHEEENNYYATGFVRNDLALTNDIIYLRNSREQNYKILNCFSNRNFYLYRYQRDTKDALLYKAVYTNGEFNYYLLGTSKK